MRIVFLVETATQIWGGVKVILEDGNGLADRGHRVTVVSRSLPPEWMQVRCDFRTVEDFAPEQIPEADLVIGTFWTTVGAAVRSGKGIPVHFCQGYEGDNPENRSLKGEIEQVYRDESAVKVTISSHLTALLKERFGCDARPIAYGVDHQVMFPGGTRPRRDPVRVGLVGPYQVAWKDIPTGIEACALAHRAGLDLQLVRVTNTSPHADEQNLPFPVEWHTQVPPSRMGDIYRSLDVFMGTSRGAEEGYFLPAVEAMACGIPCVLTDIPCFRGYGQGQYALFAAPGSASQLAEALVIAAKHPQVTDQLRRQGLRVAAAHTADNHIAELEQVLDEILAERKGRLSIDPRIHELSDLSHGLTSSLRAVSALYTERGEHAQALAHLLAAERIRPDDTEVLSELARAHRLAGHDSEALEIYSRLLQREDDSALHAGRAMVLFSMGDFEGAARGLEDALRSGPQTTEILNNLGVARCRAGDLERARQSFDRALVLEPGHAEARANLQSLAP